MSMLRRVLNLPNHSIFVRTVGSLSCVVGLLCYALSSSFKSLFGEWNPTKIFLYIILGSIINVVVLFSAKSRVSVVSRLKPHVEFLVLTLTSLYSFLADRSMKGKPDTWSVVSSGAFALTSLCLSLQRKPGFDVGLFSFFLGCVTVQLMKIHLIFILVAAGFCYPLVVLGSHSDSHSQNGDSSAEESLVIRIDDDDDANRMTSGFRYPPLVYWSYFEKWLRMAGTEQFLSDLQERERWHPPGHQEQQPPQPQQEWNKELQLQEEGPLSQEREAQQEQPHQEQPLSWHQEQPPQPQQEWNKELQLQEEGPLSQEREAQQEQPPQLEWNKELQLQEEGPLSQEREAQQQQLRWAIQLIQKKQALQKSQLRRRRRRRLLQQQNFDINFSNYERLMASVPGAGGTAAAAAEVGAAADPAGVVDKLVRAYKMRRTIMLDLNRYGLGVQKLIFT